MVYWIVLSIMIGYFIGCCHGSRVAQKLSGVNLKNAGFGNAGASNATIVLGWKFGVLVGIIDIGKGVFAVLLLRLLLHSYTTFQPEETWTLLFLVGSFVIVGHNFPITMKFKGGKGTASIIGVLLALDWKLGLLGVALLVLTSLLTDYLLIGVFVFYTVLCATAIWFVPGIWPAILSIALALLAVILHIENFQRFFHKTEPTVSSVFKKKAVS